MRYLKEEEFQMASRFLFLSMTIIVLEKDLEQIENGAFKIKEPYLNLLHDMKNLAKNERKNLRRKMREGKIDVVFVQKNDTFSTYLFIARGYEEERRYFNPAVRKKVEHLYHELMVEALKAHARFLSEVY
ncbi:hypothetical protein [Tenuibacillus multivorans]|uniref:Uncharacterized protein n=1 Tax=Tenuibacillus multivorans TaxID=237069 RepID=A0A1H0A2X4_9BACI|nr:hypothetical protein [Tenuibacillus multivorans]GEL78364.1 hypothetical protein TMU01_25990 [Tenuibacillus multivorans]SDN27571.1 hypothetical protein SAMN05216498_1928 [Tenuibacillus multivorans]